MRTLFLPPHPIKYLVLFIGTYGLLEALYFLLPNRLLLNFVYHYGIVAVSAKIIHLLTPSEILLTTANELRSAALSLRVVRGCDGAGVVFLLIAAMIAFPAKWQHKAAGALTAAALVFILNQARIVGLYYLGAYRKAWFLPVHVYLAPSIMIVIGGIFFVAWANLARPAVREAQRSL